MYIKEFIKIELDSNRYDPIYQKKVEKIVYIAIFFDDAFGHIYLLGVKEFIQKLKDRTSSGMISEMITLDIDNKNNLAYISEPTDNSTQEITPEIHQLIEDDAIIELCHRKFIGYAVMATENFYHLLLAWEKLVQNKRPFLLLYLDDKNWYDVLPFDSQEAMEKFIADHTKVESLEQ